MGIFSTLERRGSIENPNTSISQAADWLLNAWGGTPTQAGVRINEQNALELSGVFAAVRRLSEDIAKTPLQVFERLERGRRRADEHPLDLILGLRPNPEMSAFQFREMAQGHLLTWGNAYAEIERDGAGRVKHLWPITPDRVTVRRQNGRKLYRITFTNRPDITLGADSVLHIPGFGFDGMVGYSIIRLARQSLGLAKATESFGAKWFGDGSRVSGVLQHPKRLSPDAHKRLKEDWNAIHSGLDNAHRAAILEEGMTWQQIGVPPEDAQFLETRKFQVSEIARWFLIPPHKLGDLERATFSNIEQQAIEYHEDTLLGWFTRWEQILGWELFPERERRKYYVKFRGDAHLRGDSSARAAFYQSGFSSGWLTINDIRELEERNPVEGGDTPMVPLNMIPLSAADQLPDSGDTPPEGNAGRSWRDLPASVRAERRSQSVAVRRRLRTAHMPIFRDAAEKIVKREVRQLRRAVRSELEGRSVGGFQSAVEEIYRDLEGYAERRLRPVIMAYAEAIFAEASREVGAEPEAPESLGPFVGNYIRVFVRNYVRRAQAQLADIIAREVTQEAMAAAVEQRLTEWEERTPDKVAQNETVEAGGAVARFAYMAAGIGAMVWIASGTNCPLCAELDGRVVSIRDAFLSPGDTLNPPGDTAPLQAERTFTHPPIHQGCDCTIAAA